MSKVVVSTMISLDGYTEGSGGDVTAMPMDAAFGEHNADRVRSARALLFGATSYRGMLGYWPGQADNPDATPDDRYIAARYASDLDLIVVSDSLTTDEVEVWHDRTTILRRAEAHDAVARLRGDDAPGDVLIFGSRTLWTDLFAHGLVDELHVMVGPKVVRGDHRVFTDVPVTELSLLDARTWRGSDNVVLRYAVGDAAQAAPTG